jgi:para-aminobenzoate synthetase / 4-amino-4-deoxychorismate lyase
MDRRFHQGPFVLLDDARADAAMPARLFHQPLAVAAAHHPAEVAPLLDQLDQWQAAGDWAAGFLTYEAGVALEARTAPLASPLNDGWPLGWFGRFAACERIDAAAIPALLPDPAGALPGPIVPALSEAEYRSAVGRILDAIHAGDIYQANLTFQVSVAVGGHPLALYARLRQAARAGYGGIVWTGTHWLLSCSPELFLSVKGGEIVARPMKGTATRRADPVADCAATADLAADPKQRAENLMIVDLIRNDLSRIAEPGSVAVPALFRVETYPTVHQMVSDVTARIAPATPISTILRAAFPCGSITGAPKLQAMATIAATESGPRGAYTGSIGFAGPDGEAAFNVAIRTLALRDGDACATLGLGSGIVADSQAGAEWRECLAKGGFVERAGGIDFDLIETMAFDPDDGLPLLDRHLERLGSSARTLGFSFDRHELRNRLQHATFRQREAARVRIRLSVAGALAVEVTPMPPVPAAPVDVAIVSLPVPRADIRLHHKTSSRAFYDAAREAAGSFEVLFIDDAGQLTEGSFTSIFVERGGMLLTPPLSAAPLPGVLRGQLIADGRAQEGALTPADLSGGFFIGNSVRGLIPAIVAK